eukprot:TRINITY_DN4188_c0_g1_i2.p1 TRINITY_DN4188_c0_g1~~TRINITY_DN4188_c0_g1_i2.p1  ORF type:complete len:209 (+),score=21.57 TRINITY_DN4188_c0_g1_i2:160-786(+)
MFYLCVKPRKVYNKTLHHKQTKNQWARDDPAFVAILLWCMLTASVAYCVALSEQKFIQVVQSVFWAVFVDFVLVGALIATVYWWIANRYLRHNEISHTVDQSVEWLYAFDIHCNSFFPLFILLYVVQYLLLPVLYTTGILSAILSNTLYIIALGYYHYITFLGFTALPFLQNTQVFFYPFTLLVIVYIIANLLNFNATIFVINFYFAY